MPARIQGDRPELRVGDLGQAATCVVLDYCIDSGVNLDPIEGVLNGSEEAFAQAGLLGLVPRRRIGHLLFRFGMETARLQTRAPVARDKGLQLQFCLPSCSCCNRTVSVCDRQQATWAWCGVPHCGRIVTAGADAVQGAQLLSPIDRSKALDISYTGISLRVPEVPIKLQAQPSKNLPASRGLAQDAVRYRPDGTVCPDDLIEPGI